MHPPLLPWFALTLAAALAGCAAPFTAGPLFAPPAPEQLAARRIDLADREAARGMDTYASPRSAAGAWQVRCAWEPVSRKSTCLLRAGLAGPVVLVTGPDDGFVAVVGEGLTEAALSIGGGGAAGDRAASDNAPGAAVAAPRCVGLSTSRRACIWTAAAGQRALEALRASRPVRVSWRTRQDSRDVQPSLDGYAAAERSYEPELRDLKLRETQFTGGGGAGGGGGGSGGGGM